MEKTLYVSFPYTQLVESILDGLEPDVTFKIVNIKEEILGTVSAHKVILSMASPVFKTQFFGMENVDKYAKTVVVKETTTKAFQLMVDSIYNKFSSNEELGKLADPEEVFNVIDLSEKYELTHLKDALSKVMWDLEITSNIESVLTTAAVAEKYKHFPEASAFLIRNCARNVKPFLTTKQDFINASARADALGLSEIFVKLMALVVSLSNISDSIQLKFVQEDGKETNIRVMKIEVMSSIYKTYILMSKSAIDYFFVFDGRRIKVSETPEDLELEDDDMIEVHKL